MREIARRANAHRGQRRVGHPRQGGGHPGLRRRPAGRRPHHHRGLPGRRQDAARQGARPLRQLPLRAHPVHAGPPAQRRHRRERLQPEDRRLRVPPRADLRQHRARRRDQPLVAQDPGEPARVHGGAAGDDRQRHARDRRPVHGHRHAEPHRVRGHVPAARGSARPLHDAAEPRLSRRPTPRRRSCDAQTSGDPFAELEPVLDAAEVLAMQEAVRRVEVAPALRRYVVDLLDRHAREQGRLPGRQPSRRHRARARRQGAGAAARAGLRRAAGHQGPRRARAEPPHHPVARRPGARAGRRGGDRPASRERPGAQDRTDDAAHRPRDGAARRRRRHLPGGAASSAPGSSTCWRSRSSPPCSCPGLLVLATGAAPRGRAQRHARGSRWPATRCCSRSASKNGSRVPGLQVTLLRRRPASWAATIGPIDVESLGSRAERVATSGPWPARRGIHHLPALVAVAEDPLGPRAQRAALGEARWTSPSRRAWRISPPARCSPTWASPRGRQAPRCRRSAASEFRGIRPHNPGEPLNRVDWKATARTGNLMLRETEDPTDGGVTVLLNGAAAQRRRASRRTTNFELAVEAAGSIADYALAHRARHHAAAARERLAADPPHAGRRRPRASAGDPRRRRRRAGWRSSAPRCGRSSPAAAGRSARGWLILVVLALDRRARARARSPSRREGLRVAVVHVAADSFAPAAAAESSSPGLALAAAGVGYLAAGPRRRPARGPRRSRPRGPARTRAMKSVAQAAVLRELRRPRRSRRRSRSTTSARRRSAGCSSPRSPSPPSPARRGSSTGARGRSPSSCSRSAPSCCCARRCPCPADVHGIGRRSASCSSSCAPARRPTRATRSRSTSATATHVPLLLSLVVYAAVAARRLPGAEPAHGGAGPS